MVVAENIRTFAERKKVTINALADFAAVSRAQMFNVLACSSSATTDWLAKVAAALEIEPWRLMQPSTHGTAATPHAPRRKSAKSKS